MRVSTDNQPPSGFSRSICGTSIIPAACFALPRTPRDRDGRISEIRRLDDGESIESIELEPEILAGSTTKPPRSAAW